MFSLHLHYSQLDVVVVVACTHIFMRHILPLISTHQKNSAHMHSTLTHSHNEHRQPKYHIYKIQNSVFGFDAQRINADFDDDNDDDVHSEKMFL